MPRLATLACGASLHRHGGRDRLSRAFCTMIFSALQCGFIPTHHPLVSACCCAYTSRILRSRVQQGRVKCRGESLTKFEVQRLGCVSGAIGCVRCVCAVCATKELIEGVIHRFKGSTNTLMMFAKGDGCLVLVVVCHGLPAGCCRHDCFRTS